jgi:hypothetical protein
MEITYTWEITAMEVILNQDGLSKVVSNIDWRLIATVDGKPYRAEKWAKQYVSAPDADTFTNYDELTKEQVVSWLESVLDVPQLKEYLAEQISIQANPVTALLPPPFAN